MAGSVEFRSLGLTAESRLGLAAELARGLSFAAVRRLLERSGFPEHRIAAAARIRPGTWARRKRAGRFSLEESDRIARVARLFDLAEDVLGGADAARRWLEDPKLGLGGAVPLDTARTDLGALEVEALLLRIEHGVHS